MSRRKQIENLLATDDTDPFLHFGMGMEWLKEDEIDKALQCFDQALTIDERYVAAWQQKAQILVQLDRPDEARDAYDKGIEAARANGDQHAVDDLQRLKMALT